MATKPRSELSPAYRRRIERAEAKGKTRQQARGHKEHEHVERRQREAAREKKAGVLTSYHRQTIRKYADEQASKMGADSDEVREALLDWAGSHGWDRFVELREKQREEHRAWVRAGRTVGGGRGLKYLQAWADFHDDPEIGWLYYH